MELIFAIIAAFAFAVWTGRVSAGLFILCVLILLLSGVDDIASALKGRQP